MTSNPKPRRRRKSLRGKRLLEAALREIADFASWTRGEKFTWANLAVRLGVSRQTLESKAELTAAVERLRIDLRRTDGGQNSAKVVRRTLDQRIQNLEAENKALQAQLDSWVEKWVTVEHNCRLHNIDPDEILTPLAKPNRQVTAAMK